MNLNGQFFQNNAEFVTSRWTESPNGDDIYRDSKVGINFTSAADPAYELDVNGSLAISNQFIMNGEVQYADSKGIVKKSLAVISEDLTIESGYTNYSVGQIELADGYTITINSGAEWTIIGL